MVIHMARWSQIAAQLPGRTDNEVKNFWNSYIKKRLRERGIDVVVCGVPSATMTMLRRAGIVELLGEQSFYWSVERALLDHRPRPLAAFDSAEA